LAQEWSVWQILDIPPGSPPIVHKLSRAVVFNPRIVLVDPAQQHEKIDRSGPEYVTQKAIDEHRKVSDKELDQAYATALFTLSEIVFDKPHRHAIVSYSFYCGALCGQGSILLLEKVGDRWTVEKACGGWIS
jgi:hypothetical protein